MTLTQALHDLAEAFADSWTAGMVGGRMTCDEADALARVMALSGHVEQAQAFLRGHANGWDEGGDTDPADRHHHLREDARRDAS